MDCVLFIWLATESDQSTIADSFTTFELVANIKADSELIYQSKKNPKNAQKRY